MSEYIDRHLSWQKYANKEIKAGRKPTKFEDWKVSPVYFKGISEQTYESQLKRAGIDWEKDKPSARLKRSKGK
jgi:hypothetical protein